MSTPDTVVCPICLESFSWTGAQLKRFDGSDLPHPRSGAATVTVGDLQELRTQFDRAAVADILEERPLVGCPSSKDLLPIEFNDHPRLIVAIVGGVASSKTTYIAALVRDLLDGCVPDISLRPLIGGNHRLLEKSTIEPIFTDQKVVAATQGGGRLKPVSYLLTNNISNDSRVLVFADVAGEDCQDDSGALRVRYLAEATSLLFLLDPNHMSKVAARLGTGDAAEPKTHRTSIDNLVTNREQMDGQTRVDGLLRVPVAVVVGKADLIRNFSAHNVGDYLRLREHDGKGSLLLDRRQVEQESLDVASLLLAYEEERLLKRVEQSFLSFTLHFASATGTDVAHDQNGAATWRTRPRPQRVVRPLLTLLDRDGFLLNQQTAGEYRLPTS